MEQDQEFLEYVIKAIVNNPAAVSSNRTVDERGVLITLDVDPGDMGYVIGRQGQTARAVRTLLKIVGAKHNARVNLKINEPEGGRAPSHRDPARESFSRDAAPRESFSRESAPAPEMSASTLPSLEDIDTSAVDNLSI